MNFETENQIEEFEKIKDQHFDGAGKCYEANHLSCHHNHIMEQMFKLIEQLKKEVQQLENKKHINLCGSCEKDFCNCEYLRFAEMDKINDNIISCDFYKKVLETSIIERTSGDYKTFFVKASKISELLEQLPDIKNCKSSVEAFIIQELNKLIQ